MSTLEGELGKDYRIIDAASRPTRLGNQMPHHGDRRCLVHPEDATRFYDDWYRHLREQGVDMVKVDNQASHDAFGGDLINVYESARVYQHAMQRAARAYFGGELLHCMAHSNEHALATLNTNVWRSSDDYFPHRNPYLCRHVAQNAANASWNSIFAHCDWDMFQSSRPHAMFHDTARVLGPGPIYVSDKPGAHNASLIKSLVDDQGRTYRVDRPGTPTHDCVFVDVENEPRLLKVQSIAMEAGVLGVFHGQWLGENKDDASN